MAGRKFGIVIGTNEYSDSKILNLRFAEKDAKEIKDLLLDPNICGFDEVVESINKTRTQTFCEIDKLFKKAQRDDLLLIYYSGHGELDSEHDLCLLFNDTKLDSLLPTSLNYPMIRKCRKASSCKTVIVILDCCYSGAAGIKGNNLKEILAKSSGSGMIVLSASSEFDIAKEDLKLESSVFTHYIIEGLRDGAVAGDINGDIALVDLYNYAHEKTKDSQTPYLKVEGEGKIIIGKNPLKVKEKEFRRKKDKLVKKIRKELPAAVYDVSMIVLVDSYEKPEKLTETDGEIRNSLEDLLEGKISAKTYIHTVQCYLGNEEIENSRVLAKFRDPEIPKTFISPYTGMELVLIPAGKFMMGSPLEEQGRYDGEGPVHEVTIKNSFYMGKYPVTQKQWGKIMRKNPSNFKGEDRPIENVSWEDIQDFVKKLNEKEGTDKYRLPSEAEWEHACRAGTQTRYSFGDDESKLNEYAWYNQNSGSETHPVGQKKPNPWGLYDMHGNVWEWVQDKWHGDYNGAPSDGSVWEDVDCSVRIGRGGSWYFDARHCRSADRFRFNPETRDYILGFRLLREYIASEITPEVTEKAKSATTESSIVSKTSPQITNVQKSYFQQIKHKASVWENKKYNIIKILRDKYVFLKPYSQNKLAKLVIDSNSKYTLKTGEKVDLGQGYALEAKRVDVDGKKVWLEFTKDGEFVDDQIVSTDTGNHDWTCEVDKIQGEDNVPVLKVHVNQVFQGAVDSIAQIDGLWLIDFEDAFTIKPGDKINGYEIMEIADEYVSYKLPDSNAL